MTHEPTDELVSPGEPTPNSRPALAATVAGLAHAIDEVIGPGGVSSLRRLRWGDPAGSTFWRLLAIHVEEGLPAEGARRERLEQAWAVVLRGMATTSGLNRGGMRSGEALAHAGVSEGRFERLLRSGRERLADEIGAASRFVAAKGIRIDWVELARLALTDGSEGRETARRALARSYYRALHTLKD